MADNDLDTTSLSSFSRNEAPLFPVIRDEPLASGHDSEKGSSFLDLGSHPLFANWTKTKAHVVYSGPGSSGLSRVNTGQKSPSPNSTGHISSLYVKGVARHENAGADVSELRRSISSTETELGENVSLDSRIIRAIGSKLAVGGNDEILDSRGKYKYVDMYKDVSKKLQSDKKDTQLVFNVSHLDEFHQFVTLSEINQKIQDKLAQHQLSGELNVLPVLDANDFHKLYNPESVPEIVETKRRINTFPWIKRKNQAKQDVASSKASGASSSSSEPHQRTYLHRKLEVRHLQMISMGGTLGVGLYLNVGKAFTIAGGLGTVLAMLLVGLVVLATVISFCEMVTFVSVVDGVSGLSSRFVDESFGFATGWLYFFSFSFGLAGEVVALVIILSYFPSTEILTNAGSTAGFVTLFLVICIVSNILSVRVFGEIEYFTSLLKVIITFLGIVVMIVVNRGGIGDKGVLGFKYWQYLKSDFEHNLIFGPFRPTFNLFSDGTDPESEGIGGNTGRFLSLLVAIVVAAYAYSGTEIVCIAACEAKDPRKALPSATNRVFWRILLFYCLSSFVVSLNIYAGDPRLLRFYSGTTGIEPDQFDNNYAINYVGGAHCGNRDLIIAGVGNGSQSPWIVAFQSAGSCSWSSVVNAFLFFFALSCGNSHLYVSSRTIYSLALQRKAPGFLRKCNRYGTPYYAVLVAVAPGLLAYTCVSLRATTVFQNLTSLISSSGVFVWFAMCLSFVRFYYGLKRRPDIIGRNDKAYPYKSFLQPYSAIFGLFGSAVILLAMGYVVFLNGCWDTWFFFASYGTLMIFAILYVGHWIVKGTRISSLEALDFDSGRREKDIYIWDGGREYNLRKAKDLAHKVLDWMA
ncbi:amino acid sensor membrane component, YAT family [Metschnikowia aff. pulcherrima]|uniref:Amino acid sensor membrane component, YAT family n=1 Tax=Metschnikowia aff. pulcherrima TaxID=2163413 RepID=A0A4P6XVB7_9ASCO|nr:amino acid sensor membrane component, YAT family [Metschnikowia aff. pulcherrima]